MSPKHIKAAQKSAAQLWEMAQSLMSRASVNTKDRIALNVKLYLDKALWAFCDLQL